MDQEDAEKYDKAIKTLQENQVSITSHLNQQISLTTEIIDNFNKTISLICHNQKTIRLGINTISHKLNKFIFDFDHYMYTRNILDQINLTLDMVMEIINDIELSITFAKLKVLHTSIIKPKEINSQIQILFQHYSADQLLYTKYEDLIKYYDIIEVEAFYMDRKIVFVLHFPLIHPLSFDLYHLYSIPSMNSTTILPPDTFLAMNSETYQYMSQPCKKLKDGYFCEETSLNPKTKNDCIFQILQLSDIEVPCPSIPVVNKQEVVEQIDEANYILLLPNKTKIYTSCGKMDFSILQGNFLVHLPYGCELKTPKYVFSNQESKTEGQALLLPEIKISPEKIEENIKDIEIQNVPLDQLHTLQKQQREMSQVSLKEVDSTPPYAWSLPVYIILIIGITLIAIWKYTSKKAPPMAPIPEVNGARNPTLPNFLPEVRS